MTVEERARYINPGDLDIRKVRISVGAMELIAEMASEVKSARVTVDWGEPDAEGFYTPTFTTAHLDYPVK